LQRQRWQLPDGWTGSENGKLTELESVGHPVEPMEARSDSAELSATVETLLG